MEPNREQSPGARAVQIDDTRTSWAVGTLDGKRMKLVSCEAAVGQRTTALLCPQFTCAHAQSCKDIFPERWYRKRFVSMSAHVSSRPLGGVSFVPLSNPQASGLMDTDN